MDFKKLAYEKKEELLNILSKLINFESVLDEYKPNSDAPFGQENKKALEYILAEAKKEAELIKGEGEFTAANIYNKAFGKDPEFYEFYKTMEIYKNTVLKENSKVIISQDNLVYKNLIGN